jgi:hypothetical protein
VVYKPVNRQTEILTSALFLSSEYGAEAIFWDQTTEWDVLLKKACGGGGDKTGAVLLFQIWGTSHPAHSGIHHLKS